MRNSNIKINKFLLFSCTYFERFGVQIDYETFEHIHIYYHIEY